MKITNGLKYKRKKINDLGWATTFRIENWDSSKNIKYRLLHGKKSIF